MYATTNSTYGGFYSRRAQQQLREVSLPVIVRLYGDCDICQDKIKLEQTKILRCGHYFHKTCIDRWHQQRHNCPICRSE